MNIQYGFLDATTGTGSTAPFSGPHTEGDDFSYVAVGAFDGNSGLDPDYTPLLSVADFESYLTQLEAKTTQISAQAMSLDLVGITTQYVVLGGTGADVVTVDATSTADGLMIGRAGDDSLTGGAGHNTLEGGAGDDTLISRGTGDKLVGGPGADHIEINALVQADAANVGALGAGDVLDFSGAAAGLGLAHFNAVSHFHGHAGDVKAHFHAAGDHTVFLFDTDGDGVADHSVTVRGGDYTDYAHVAGVSHPVAVGPDPTVAAPGHDHAAAIVDAHALVV